MFGSLPKTSIKTIFEQLRSDISNEVFMNIYQEAI